MRTGKFVEKIQIPSTGGTDLTLDSAVSLSSSTVRGATVGGERGRGRGEGEMQL
jgi:hypothetical protein